MAFSNGFRGTPGGSVQNNITDQPGIAVPGMVAFASDLNNIDAYYVGGTIGTDPGIGAGIGVTLDDVTDLISGQRPNLAANLPGDADAAAAFAGIIVFDESMQSDENGIPGWAPGRIARVAKPGRAGARIYVEAIEAIDHTADTVNWCTIAGTDLLYDKGQFAPSALAGDAAGGTSVLIPATVARWITSAAVGEVAILELW